MNIRQVLKNIRLKFNMVGSGRRKNKLNSIDFSIISNNCFAGIVYQHFNLQYNTPTVGLYFYPDEYIKFCKKFDYYIGQKLTFRPCPYIFVLVFCSEKQLISLFAIQHI